MLTKEEQITWDRLKYGLPLDEPTWSYSTYKPHLPSAGCIYFETSTASMMVFDGKEWSKIQ